MARNIVVIGGSGFADKLSGTKREVNTPFGKVTVLISESDGKTLCAIKRHGEGHTVPPHKVNYRANLYAAKELNAEAILASSAVGIITPDKFSPGDLVLCRDLIGLNLVLGGEPVTFFHDFSGGIHHPDASEIFSKNLNSILLQAADYNGISLKTEAVLTLTYGPRYETPAEIRALRILGADLTGMTTIYEASLALDLGIPYSVIAIGTNLGAGLGGKLSHLEVIEMMGKRSEDIYNILISALKIM